MPTFTQLLSIHLCAGWNHRFNELMIAYKWVSLPFDFFWLFTHELVGLATWKHLTFHFLCFWRLTGADYFQSTHEPLSEIRQLGCISELSRRKNIHGSLWYISLTFYFSHPLGIRLLETEEELIDYIGTHLKKLLGQQCPSSLAVT